jgi:hypothetical protein
MKIIHECRSWKRNRAELSGFHISNKTGCAKANKRSSEAMLLLQEVKFASSPSISGLISIYLRPYLHQSQASNQQASHYRVEYECEQQPKKWIAIEDCDLIISKTNYIPNTSRLDGPGRVAPLLKCHS